MSTLPTSTIEMHRAGYGQDHSMVIRQPTTLEVTTQGQESRPKGPFQAMTDSARGHLIAMIGEFLGTTMFLFFGYIAAQTGNEKTDDLLRPKAGATSSPSGPSLLQISYIASVFGLSLAANVFIWYRVSGGMFNPSVALGLWLAGAFNWVRFACVVPMQFLGGITAAGIVSAVLPGPLQAENSVGPGVTIGQGFAMEAMLTFMLMMTILMLAVEKSRVSFAAPLIIGTSLLIIHLVGINVSGASVNPARTFGPALVNHHYVPETWIYFIGPTLGVSIAAAVHVLLKALAYQTANPGQDGDGMLFYRLMEPSVPRDSGISIKEPDFTYPPPVQYPSSRQNEKSDGQVLQREVSPTRKRQINKKMNYPIGSVGHF